MKFVHIADTHFDMPFVQLKGKKNLIKKKRLEQKFAFSKVIEYIKENDVELLFFSGDLFDQKYVEEDTINFLISSFKSIPNTKVYIAPGNHDPLIKASPYNTYEWPENVYIFSNEVGEYDYSYIRIYGLGFNDYEMDIDEISKIKVDDSRINILVTHGTLNGNSKKYHDIKEADLIKFDYVALGHVHLPKVDDTGIIYPGSLTSRRI